MTGVSEETAQHAVHGEETGVLEHLHRPRRPSPFALGKDSATRAGLRLTVPRDHHSSWGSPLEVLNV